MKIGLIASNWRPIPGGNKNIFAPGIIIQSLANGLVEKGHDVTLFAPEGTETKANLITEGLRSAYEDYHNEWENDLGTFLQIEQEYEMVILSKAFEMANKNFFDLVHVHKTNIEPFFANLINCPMVITSHNSYLKAKAPIFSKADKIRLEKYKNICYYTALSNFIKNEVDLNFVDTVYNGIDLKKYNFSPEGGKELVYVGRMIAGKGPDLAMQLAEKTTHKINIIGDIRTGLKNKIFWDKLKLQIKKSTYTKYIGFIPYNEMAPYYQNAKALIMPIREPEPFGLVMIEAMACGTPIVAFRRGSVPEIVKDGVTGFVCPPDDINAMTKAVKRIYEMPQKEYQAMRKACRKHVEGNFIVEKMVDGYEKVYQKILEKK